MISTLADYRDRAITTAPCKTWLAAETAAEALSRSFTDDLAHADDIEIPVSLAKPFLKRFGGTR